MRYPALGRRFQGKLRKKRHIGLSLALCPDAISSSLARSVGIAGPAQQAAYARAFEAEFEAELAACTPYESLLFSDEGLYARSPIAAAPVVQFLQRYTEDISVICYLRRPDRLVQSAYAQVVKMGSTETFAEFFERFVHKSSIFAKVLPWVEALGPDKITLRMVPRDMSGEAARGGDIVADFAHWLGVALEPSSPEIVNPSLSLAGCEILRRVNMAFPAQDTETQPQFRDTPRDYFKALLRTHTGGGAIALTEKERAALRASFGADQSRLLAALGRPSDQDLYRLGDMPVQARGAAPISAAEAERLAEALRQDPEGWEALVRAEAAAPAARLKRIS